MRIACQAVLFDSDGVLVDSDASVVTAWRRWSLQYGLDPDDVIPTVHGRRSADTVAALIDPARQAQALTDVDTYEVGVALHAVAGTGRARTSTISGTNAICACSTPAAIVTAVPGAAQLVASIPSDARAVVTSAKRALVRARLAAAGIAAPAVLIAAEDVSAGKPDPAGYLAAAAALGVRAHLTVVVEDSVSGIAAARAAGVGAVIGVSDRALAADADVVVEDLRAVHWEPGALVVDDTGTLRSGRA